MSSVVSRTVEGVTHCIEVPETIADAPTRWTPEQIDAAFNRGIREMFGSTLQTRLNKGDSLEQIQIYFHNEWHPGMSPERQRLSPAEKGLRAAKKAMEGMPIEEMTASIDEMLKSLKDEKASLK